MVNIEELKLAGATNALREKIGNLIWRLKRNHEGIMKDGKFIRLDKAIKDGREIIDDIERVFAALKEIEKGHK
jgi:hypothetical protein